MNVPVPAGTYAEAFPVLQADGWTGVLPLQPGTKDQPPRGVTGWVGVDPSAADCQEWADHFPVFRGTSQTALRMPEGVVGIDVDAYDSKTGKATLAEAERRWGALPDGPWSSARDDGVSGIRFLRVPAGTVLLDAVSFDGTTDEKGLGGIELIQRHHRYAVVWPSIHPTIGAPYTWRDTAGPAIHPRVDELPFLPPAWVDGLRNTGARPGELAVSTAEVAAFESAHRSRDNTAFPRGVLGVFQRDVLRGDSRHDAILKALCMAARESRAGAYPAEEAIAILRPAFIEAVLVDRSRTEALAAREFASAWRWAVGQVTGLSPDQARAQMANPGGVVRVQKITSTAGAAQPAAGPQYQLPPEFWTARPALQHIRDAARARFCAPDAVLGAVLARQSAFLDPGDNVDLGLGDGAPMSVFSIPLGGPGTGKGKAIRCAAALCPVPEHLDDFRERSIGGSGEGIIEAYYGVVTIESEDGKTRARTERKQVRHNVLFVLDEGEALVRLMVGRNGTTIAQTIRSAWSGEAIGQANASAERDRQLTAGGYSIGLVVAFQPDTIGPLFDPTQIGGGTPHRFIYVSALDPMAPDVAPDWPGELVVPRRSDPELATQWRTSEPTTYRLGDDSIRAEIQAARLAGLRGHSQLDAQDTHLTQLRGRIAAHLARFDGRTIVDAEDWELAEVVVTTSGAMRDAAIEHGRARESQVREQRRAHAIEQAVGISEATAQSAERRLDERTERCAELLTRRVRRAGGAGLPQRGLKDAAGSRYRDVLGDAITTAASAGWIARGDDGLFRAGPNASEVGE